MTAKWQKIPIEKLKEIFENSKSYKEIAQKLDYNYCGKSLKMIKNIAKQYDFVLNLTTKTKIQQQQEKIDMIGKIFGRLTVLEFDEERIKETNRTYFKCQCSCGKVSSVRMDGLLDKNNPILSCGCLQKEKASQQGVNNKEDLTGQVFGKLTAIEYNKEQSEKRKTACWVCQCECGNKIIAARASLKRGQKSCGCLNSKGEYIIKQILDDCSIIYEQQKTFTDLVGKQHSLKFDFYLPNENICIEYQGEQHYFPVDYFGGEEKFVIQQNYDKLKEKYCKEYNIKLINIPYWDYDKINKEYILTLIKEY